MITAVLSTHIFCFYFLLENLYPLAKMEIMSSEFSHKVPHYGGHKRQRNIEVYDANPEDFHTRLTVGVKCKD